METAGKLLTAGLVTAGVIIVLNQGPEDFRKKPYLKDHQLIIKKAGLGTYRPPPPSVFEEREEKPTTPQKPPLSTRDVEVGPYVIHVERRPTTCSLKLYENLEGWQRKLRGTWSGEPGACDNKVEQVRTVINEVRAERKRISGVKAPPGTPPPAEPEEQFKVVIGEDKGDAQFKSVNPMGEKKALDFAKGLSVGVKEEVFVLDADNSSLVEAVFKKGKKVG